MVNNPSCSSNVSAMIAKIHWLKMTYSLLEPPGDSAIKPRKEIESPVYGHDRTLSVSVVLVSRKVNFFT